MSNGKLTEIEVLRDDQPILRIGLGGEIKVDCASGKVDNMDDVMTALA